MVERNPVAEDALIRAIANDPRIADQNAILDTIPFVETSEPTMTHETTVSKPTNPKDAVGIRKVPFSTVPAPIMGLLGLAMLEGARKYGRHNYRIAGVRNSVYYDALMRHVTAWWEGQDIDPDSGLPHLIKAMSTLLVLVDAQMNGKCTDDRPPPFADQQWVARLNSMAGEIIDKYPEAKPPYVKGDTEIRP